MMYVIQLKGKQVVGWLKSIEGFGVYTDAKHQNSQILVAVTVVLAAPPVLGASKLEISKDRLRQLGLSLE